MKRRRPMRHRDRIWSWREGGRIRSLKRDGLPEDFARAVAKAEFDRRKKLAELFGSKIERSAKLLVSYLPVEDDYDDIRFHLSVPDSALQDETDRKLMAEFMRTNALI